MIRPPVFVNEQPKLNASLLTENLCIVPVAEANCGHPRAFVPECLLVVTQLRDVLPAENSPIVAKECNQSRSVGPE